MKISKNNNQFTNKFSVPDLDNKIDKNIETIKSKTQRFAAPIAF